MHVHILGICGTFMGGVAALARQAGHRVSGSDRNIYPPMSDQLDALGIEVLPDDDLGPLEAGPDEVIIGNALSRGHPQVEYVLDSGLPYTSGPEWLSREVLAGRHVLACAGTHGKTTTASMLTWVLDQAGLEPGYLIGGVPQGSGRSAELGEGECFVVEADEYDTAFFDKRSKFVHYRPRTAILNNLEFDHADIFPDLAAIQRQFHHLVRTVPESGRLIVNDDDAALGEVLDMGCWTSIETFGGEGGWRAEPLDPACRRFEVLLDGERAGSVEWSCIGRHNMLNALATIAAARHVGVAPSRACEALSGFSGVRRRMELRGEVGGIQVFDDFAHHPTAIRTTLDGLRAELGEEPRILAILEPRSNTMRGGHHSATLAAALEPADQVFVLQPEGVDWDVGAALSALPSADTFASVDAIVEAVIESAEPGDRVLVMSNGGFGGIHEKLLGALDQRHG